MGDVIKIRRGPTAARTARTLELGIPYMDVERKELYVHDGFTAGGAGIGVCNYRSAPPNSITGWLWDNGSSNNLFSVTSSTGYVVFRRSDGYQARFGDGTPGNVVIKSGGADSGSVSNASAGLVEYIIYPVDVDYKPSLTGKLTNLTTWGDHISGGVLSMDIRGNKHIDIIAAEDTPANVLLGDNPALTSIHVTHILGKCAILEDMPSLTYSEFTLMDGQRLIVRGCPLLSYMVVYNVCGYIDLYYQSALTDIEFFGGNEDLNGLRLPQEIENISLWDIDLTELDVSYCPGLTSFTISGFTIQRLLFPATWDSAIDLSNLGLTHFSANGATAGDYDLSNNNLTKSAIEEFFDGLGEGTGTITVTGNPGAADAVVAIAENKGWTVVTSE